MELRRWNEKSEVVLGFFRMHAISRAKDDPARPAPAPGASTGQRALPEQPARAHRPGAPGPASRTLPCHNTAARACAASAWLTQLAARAPCAAPRRVCRQGVLLTLCMGAITQVAARSLLPSFLQGLGPVTTFICRQMISVIQDKYKDTSGSKEKVRASWRHGACASHARVVCAHLRHPPPQRDGHPTAPVA